ERTERAGVFFAPAMRCTEDVWGVTIRSDLAGLVFDCEVLMRGEMRLKRQADREKYGATNRLIFNSLGNSLPRTGCLLMDTADSSF
ncbi:MAG TPA: hypothetical protein VEB86_12095, partial [Chryseosolibacter sp.]|nr:hypothetical protein [Chryseosolibacter sp.]